MSRQKKAILLLVNDSGLQMFIWDQGALTWKGAYRSSPAELEDFGSALDSYRELPVIIVADLIEESFRHDTVVHVSGGDRTAVLKRKLDFVFRNTTYRLAKVTERETTGRRDDRVMLSAITKPDLIDVWVRVLVEKRFAIQSITSVAHLLHEFSTISKLDKEEHMLLINVEQGGNLRQTFVRKGVVMFSRLTPMQARENALLGSDILQETLQLRQYFKRIQFVPYEAVLRIHVYSTLDDSFLQLESRSSETNRFEVANVAPLLDALKVDLGGQEPSPVHYFVAQVLAGRQPANVYAPPAATKYQDLRSFSRMIWISTAAVLLIGLGVCIMPALSVWDQWQQRDAYLAQTRPLEAEYAELTERFPATPIPSREMQLVVETNDVISQQVHLPLEALNMISRAFSSSTGLELTSIDWALAEKAAAPVVVPEGGEEYFEPAPQPTPAEAQLAAAGITGLVLKNQTAINVEITGEAFSPDSPREAQEQVLAFIEALEMNPGVSVFASQMPTEVRTDIVVTTTVDDSEVRGPFTLQLTIVDPEPQQVAAEEAQP